MPATSISLSSFSSPRTCSRLASKKYTKTGSSRTSRTRSSATAEAQDVNKMQWGVTSTLLLSLSMVTFWTLNPKQVQYFRASVAITGMTAVVQACYELKVMKMVLRFQYSEITNLQLRAVLFKTIVTQFMYFFTQLYTTPLLSAISLLAYQLALLLLLLNKSTDSSSTLPLTPVQLQKLKSQSLQFAKLSIAKLVIQESQRMLAIKQSSQLGFYFLASNLAGIIPRFIFQPLDEILANLLPTLTPDQFSKTLQLMMRIVLMFTTSLFLFCGVYADSALSLMYADRYNGSSIYLVMQIGLLILSSLQGIFQTAVVSLNSKIVSFTKSLYAITFLSLIISVAVGSSSISEIQKLLAVGVAVLLFRLISACWHIRCALPSISYRLESKDILIISLFVVLALLGNWCLGANKVVNLGVGGVLYLCGLGAGVLFLRDELIRIKRMKAE